MMLPDITGMEVLHRLKADPKTADIPVIIVSVLLPEQTGDADQGAVDHITKPFAFEKLMESIRRTLDVPK
jgi:CheY-like chemotaxis protein